MPILYRLTVRDGSIVKADEQIDPHKEGDVRICVRKYPICCKCEGRSQEVLVGEMNNLAILYEMDQRWYECGTCNCYTYHINHFEFIQKPCLLE